MSSREQQEHEHCKLANWPTGHHSSHLNGYLIISSICLFFFFFFSLASYLVLERHSQRRFGHNHLQEPEVNLMLEKILLYFLVLVLVLLNEFQ